MDVREKRDEVIFPNFRINTELYPAQFFLSRRDHYFYDLTASRKQDELPLAPHSRKMSQASDDSFHNNTLTAKK